MIWSPSDFISFMALNSSLVKLGLGVLDCFRILEISAPNSSASVGLRVWWAISIAVIYSLYRGVIGATVKSGPCTKGVFYVSDRGFLIDLQPNICLALMVCGPGLSSHFFLIFATIAAMLFLMP